MSSSIRTRLTFSFALAVAPLVLAGCSGSDSSADEGYAASTTDGLRGGKRNACTGTPAVTVTPSTLAVGTTIGQGGTYLQFNATGVCGIFTVFVGSSQLPLCYSGGYVSSTGGASLTWPYTGFGAAANESYTFTTPGTYTLGLWQANSDPSGGYSLGTLLATTTLTVQ